MFEQATPANLCCKPLPGEISVHNIPHGPVHPVGFAGYITLDIATHMHELSALIESATQRLPKQYFQVAIDGGDPIYRERVYCYELYHQLRCLWPIATDYYLNGELDKAAHPILKGLGAAGIKPDLLVHKPGYMSGNHAMIEVKPCRAQPTGIKKDLENLALFKKKVGYERAIYLVFGYEAEAKLVQVRKIAQKIGDLPGIELWSHRAPGQSASYEGDV